MRIAKVEHWRGDQWMATFTIDDRMLHWDMYLNRCEGNNDTFMLSDDNFLSIMRFEFGEDMILCHIERSSNARGDEKPYALCFLYDGFGPFLLLKNRITVNQIRVHSLHDPHKNGIIDGIILGRSMDDFMHGFIAKSDDKYYEGWIEDLTEEIRRELKLDS